MSKKNYICFVSALLLTLNTAAAYDFKSGEIYYTITSDANCTAEVACGYPGEESPQTRGLWMSECENWPGNSYAGIVDIPAEVTYGGKTYAVIGIGKGAFVNCKELDAVTIPTSVTYINNESFYGCPALTHILLPDGIDRIGTMAFAGCVKLSHLDYPESMTYIPDQCFQRTGSAAGDFVLTGYENVTDYGTYSFSDSAVKNFSFDDTEVQNLGFNMFHDSTLEEMTLPATRDDGWYANALICTSVSSLKTLRLDRKDPPVIDAAEAHPDVSSVLPQCVLVVPDESVEAYSATFFWKEFRHIIGFSSASIATATTDADSHAEYYDLNGVRVQGDLKQGIYLKRCRDKTSKVIVK